MMPSVGQMIGMVGRTLRSPREGAEEVLALGIPREAVWIIIALVVVLSVVLAQITGLLITATGDEMMAGLFGNPLVTGVVQLLILLLTIAAVHIVGRAMGGTGNLVEAAILISWLQFVMVCIQVVQTVAMVFTPPLAGLIGIAALFLFLWLLTNFIAVLHGFRSLAQVFLMILVASFTLAFFASILLTLLGVGIQMPMGQV